LLPKGHEAIRQQARRENSSRATRDQP
jgi:hypothetical protein